MKMKNIALMGLGAASVLAYQKYSKPMMKKMENAVTKGSKKTKKILEDMM